MPMTSVCDGCTDERPPPDRGRFYTEALRMAQDDLIEEAAGLAHDAMDEAMEGEDEPQASTRNGPRPGSYAHFMQHLHDPIYPGAKLTVIQVG